MSEVLTPLREYHLLLERLKRVRARTYKEQDIVEVCSALERRLVKEEKERASNRLTQQRYRAAKRREVAE